MIGEIKAESIFKAQFTAAHQLIVLHTHCYQKVLSSSKYSAYILAFPTYYSLRKISSGCCGIAGAFGYEKEHYEVSQIVGELVPFPFLGNIKNDTLNAAAGTSCRHQVKAGVSMTALHPVEILYNALLW